MKFLYGLGGANIPVIKEFELGNYSEAIEAGQALKCTNRGLVGKNVEGTYIGVAAEDHSGKEDLLNARANGNKIRVDITKDAVYSVPMMRLEAIENGSAITFICQGGFLIGKHPGCHLMLVSKGEDSTNTDAVGTMRLIEDVSSDGATCTYYLGTGGVTCKGDVYALVPYVGFSGGVDLDYKSMDFCSDAGTELTVVGIDTANATVEAKFSTGFFN